MVDPSPMTAADIVAAGGATANQINLIPYGGAIGDSITADNSNVSIRTNDAVPALNGNVLKGADGYINWALALSGQRVRIPSHYMWGYPGEETNQILFARLDKLLSMTPRPSFVIIECGTNNIGHDPAGSGVGSYAAIIADWQQAIDKCMAKGVRVIMVPILPRGPGFSPLFSAAQFDVMDRCNRWQNRVAQLSNGRVAVANTTMSQLTNPLSEGAQPASGMTRDNTHNAVAGAYYVGKAIAAILNNWFPPLNLLPASNMKWSAAAPYGNLLVNGMLKTGTSYGAGTITAPSAGTLTGTVPDQWTARMSESSGLTVTGSQSAGASWGLYPGCNTHQMALSGSYSVMGSSSGPTYAHSSSLVRNVNVGGLSIGDTAEALIYCEIDVGSSGIAVPNLEWRWNGASNWNADMHGGTRELSGNVNENIAIVLRTEPHTFDAVPANGTCVLIPKVQLKSNPDGAVNPSGNVRFGMAVVQKVEA